MSGEGLVELARQYVRLSDQLEAVRGEIKRVVLNGGDGSPVFPTSAFSGHQDAMRAWPTKPL